jgi:hypothetical protein
MNENNVVELLKHGTLDEFLDCLDFAPEGVIELIKKYAVELPLDNYEKRQALKNKTGFDVDAAVANSGLEPDPKKEEEIKQASETPATGRRTVATKYKVVTQA